MPNPRGDLPLDACPFCGGEAECISGAPEVWIRCKQCKCCTDTFNFPKTAIEVWNTRADSADAPLRGALAEQAKILLSALYPAMLLTKLDMEAKQTVLDNDNKVLGVVHVLQEIANGEALATAPEAPGVGAEANRINRDFEGDWNKGGSE